MPFQQDSVSGERFLLLLLLLHHSCLPTTDIADPIRTQLVGVPSLRDCVRVRRVHLVHSASVVSLPLLPLAQLLYSPRTNPLVLIIISIVLRAQP